MPDAPKKNPAVGELRGLPEISVTPTGQRESAKTLENVDFEQAPDIKSDNSTVEHRLLTAFRHLNAAQCEAVLAIVEQPGAWQSKDVWGFLKSTRMETTR